MDPVLIVRAWTELLYLDLVGVLGFKMIHRVVATTRTRPATSRTANIADVVNAMKAANVFYFKTAMCLQRSAVVTRLLRRRGIPAQLVIGCQPVAFQSHAWVEVAGTVVSDHRPGLQHYHVIDRW
jgi:hypothetical protein